MDINELRNEPFQSAKEFFEVLPKRIRPEYLEDVETNIHFDIEGEGGGQFSVIVRDNAMQVLDHHEGEPECLVTVSEKNFLALLRGELNPMMAIFTGKIKISDPAVMMRYAKMFGLA